MTWIRSEVAGGGEKFIHTGIVIVHLPGTVYRVYDFDGTHTDFTTLAAAKSHGEELTGLYAHP